MGHASARSRRGSRATAGACGRAAATRRGRPRRGPRRRRARARTRASVAVPRGRQLRWVPPREDGPPGPYRRFRLARYLKARERGIGRHAAANRRAPQRPQTGASAPTLARLEDTLTEGYARALALEAERWRLERRIGEVARTVAGPARRLERRRGALIARHAPDARRRRADAAARAPRLAAETRPQHAPRDPLGPLAS